MRHGLHPLPYIPSNVRRSTPLHHWLQCLRHAAIVLDRRSIAVGRLERVRYVKNERGNNPKHHGQPRQDDNSFHLRRHRYTLFRLLHDFQVSLEVLLLEETSRSDEGTP